MKYNQIPKETNITTPNNNCNFLNNDSNTEKCEFLLPVQAVLKFVIVPMSPNVQLDDCMSTYESLFDCNSSKIGIQLDTINGE